MALFVSNSEKENGELLHIRNRIRIHMYLGLPNPDPLVRGRDPDPAPGSFPFLIKVMSGLK
jgi:hypothetical protein